ncbi:MAG: hypothetical protein QOE51_634 [Actinoplanes sp.]|jgi:hypothetical protein|nr:hypothetical protein [Actinoplanes sp.]
MDLHDHLDLIAGQETPAAVAEADADLVRGRRALRRRRAATGAGASVFVFAAAAAVVVASISGAAPGKIQQPPAALPTTVTTTKGSLTQAHLVAYVGQQPAGYTIDKVPSGWEIQGADDYVLTIAPKGIPDKDPSTFVGKIMIALQSSDDHSTPQGTKVDVGGLKGVINEPEHGEAPGGRKPVPSGVDARRQDDSHSKNLWVQQDNGNWLQVQIWDASGWTNADIADFGAGIHVLASAKKSVG